MEAKRLRSDEVRVTVLKDDLMQAWKVLEKVVVSLADIGRHHATTGAPRAMNEVEKRAMLEDLDAFLTPELLRELGEARRRVVEYLPRDETEQLSDNEIKYWTPADK